MEKFGPNPLYHTEIFYCTKFKIQRLGEKES